jgi:hypothetical protein
MTDGAEDIEIKKPIQVSAEIPYLTISGIQVGCCPLQLPRTCVIALKRCPTKVLKLQIRYLKISDKSGYTSVSASGPSGGV